VVSSQVSGADGGTPQTYVTLVADSTDGKTATSSGVSLSNVKQVDSISPLTVPSASNSLPLGAALRHARGHEVDHAQGHGKPSGRSAG
jgi:hypothetical protein